MRLIFGFGAALALAVALPVDVRAEEYVFDVDGKFVNISFESKMDVEDILGVSNKISGSVSLGKDGAGAFDIKVPVDSLKTGIDMRDEHLRSSHWLDAAKYPHIRFYGKTIKPSGKDKYEIAGNFVMHGVEKTFKVVVEVARIPKEKAAKAGMGDINWVRVRATFVVKLSDFGIKLPEQAAGKVADEWTVKISVFAKGK